MSELQLALDKAVHAPLWLAYALLALAAIVTLFGRHGQRVLNAALLGGAVFAAAFLGLRGVLHAWLPGIVAIVAGVLAALFGFVATGWGTAFVFAAMLATAGGVAAQALGLHPFLGAAPGVGFGLLIGITNHLRLSVLLPPIFSALFVALGAAIGWAPNWRGAALHQLNDVRWTLGLAAVLAVPLLALSLEREYRRKLRLRARTKQMEDDALKKKVASQRAAFERAHELDQAKRG